MSRHLRIAGVLLLGATTGCYRMTITNGPGPVEARPALADQWRSGTVVDAVQVDTPVPLQALCKDSGWAKIEQRRTFVNGIVDVFLAGGVVYESTHASVWCAAPPGKAAPSSPAPAPPPGPAPAPEHTL